VYAHLVGYFIRAAEFDSPGKPLLSEGLRGYLTQLRTAFESLHRDACASQRNDLSTSPSRPDQD